MYNIIATIKGVQYFSAHFDNIADAVNDITKKFARAMGMPYDDAIDELAHFEQTNQMSEFLYLDNVLVRMEDHI